LGRRCWGCDGCGLRKKLRRGWFSAMMRPKTPRTKTIARINAVPGARRARSS
jgi:hypothetical protein